MKPIFLALLLWLFTLPTFAALDRAVVTQLGDEDSDVKIAAIQKLAQSAEPEALGILQALVDGTLQGADGEAITINNRVRREIDGALAALKLFHPDRKIRLAAAKELTVNLANEADPGMAPMLARARDKETDDKVKAAIAQAYALATLKHADAAVRLTAVKALAGSGDPNIKLLLLAMTDPANESEVTVRRAAIAAHAEVKSRLALGETVGRIFSGLSLGSILLLAALGLAITYGVMGVINMAHGELLMIGAYATYFMQAQFRTYLPGWLDWYVLAAIPLAFAAAAAVGVLLERTVIRWLYGRPLETLLATWGLSLILIQAARVLFGAQNVEVANPSWMSGGIELMPSIVLPLNRIVIVGFALFVLALVWVLMNRTRLGLFVRAVTQNRAMAGCVGVPTAQIDSVAFALGAGIAGLGGVALSQIANVGPDMGQGYIVDSFMVVVLGGVGQLAGAVWAALGLGVVSKFLEGWAGAVIAKIVVLVFIIMFIQKRPQGLFALKGRFVES
ncbi:MAG: urea ABC transporter permease subunit UrtB [Proteobacteria bacterium]|nr:urea ABC transporter permease subunit UrtB [Pseudomonadota bacterium]